MEDLVRVHGRDETAVKALDGLSFSVGEAEMLAVVGVSGSGKSTLLHLLGGLDTPTSGRIRVAGEDLAAHDSGARALYRRTQVGFVFQQFHLLSFQTARGNIEIALTFRGVPRRKRPELAEQALEEVGLAQRQHHRPAELSGGEQQRVAIARALVHRPPLLLADEPTGNLDRRNSREIVALLRTRCRELGTTVVLVTHDEDMAREMADRVLRLDDGRVLAGEPPG